MGNEGVKGKPVIDHTAPDPLPSCNRVRACLPQKTKSKTPGV
jgi:hypothetical protein